MAFKNIQQIRKENLLLLKDEKTFKEIESITGISASLLSQFKNNHRNMGEKVARDLEDKMGLESGWLDKDRANNNLPETKDIAMALFSALPSQEKKEFLKIAIGEL